MGKTDFEGIYRHLKSQITNLSGKISSYSDQFDPNNNFIGIIIYAMNGKHIWKKSFGKAAGCREHSLYVIMKSTASVPDQKAVSYRKAPLEEILGRDLEKNKVLCGGFSYQGGILKFSSARLNQSPDQISFNGKPAECDGTEYLSKKERILVKLCWNEYVKKGPRTTFFIPSEIENQILC